MIGRTSLVEQKRIQWAREREEMARFGGNWGLLKNNANIRTSIRSYPSDGRMSLAETKDKHTPSKPFRAAGHYGSTVSLKSLASETSANGTTSLKCLDCNGGSLINLHEQPEVAQIRHRSPSLPPIYCKEQQPYQSQGQQRDFAVSGLRRQPEKPQRHDRRSSDHYANLENNNYGSQGEEREGETSGYASDSVDAPVSASGTLLPGRKPPAGYTMDKTWQNPYCTTPESSLPPSRRLSDSRMGELNRPRWGSVWGQETARGDPPAPSWLARLGHSSQVLVINHESASSSDSSTIGSTGSDNKTYLRGQNIPVDANVLQEREARRQKALELQSAIKKQLEEKDRRRKEEKERRLREERLEEERIKREREKEKERFEEEQKRIREREAAKFRQAEAMREVLEAAERLAKEQRKARHKREETTSTSSRNCESSSSRFDESYPSDQSANFSKELHTNAEKKDPATEKEDNQKETYAPEKPEDTNNVKPVQVPVSKDVAIVLSGRLEDSELLSKANLQLVNLVLTPTPRNFESNATNASAGLNGFVHNLGNLNFTSTSSIPSSINEKRLLTPSKHRATNGRDFGTQTDIENDLRDFQEEMQIKDVSIKDHKDATNASKRDVEKSTGEINARTFPRSKSQPRTSIESRPQWNANRPGTRYRTQSEKDPHYQRRMRMRRRQVESSDERSRSPSPDRRKLVNVKTKIRTNRRKVKGDSYDADLSMDSLNSIVPLRTDKNGRIHVEDNKCERNDKENENSNVWCGQEILSKLSTLKNLDDLLKEDKKDANLLPDLSKATCSSQEEFRRILENCPEFKIKTEKVKKDDAKVRDKEFSWRPSKKELKALGREWSYGNPVPPDMRGLNLRELQQVAIDWRMLTPVRPKHRQDEEMFSRLVEMGKLEAKTIVKERRSTISPIRRSKNRAGIIESSVKICAECGEEFCYGEFCGDVLYDSFVRVAVASKQTKVKVSADTEAIIAKMDDKKKRKKKKRIKSKSRTPRKTARLLIRRKKSTSNDMESSNEKNCVSKPIKPFKRKCSKYTKKGLRK